jgi:hypothetical protein
MDGYACSEMVAQASSLRKMIKMLIHIHNRRKYSTSLCYTILDNVLATIIE